MRTPPPVESSSPPVKGRSRRRRLLVVGGLLAAGAAAGVARRRLASPGGDAPEAGGDEERTALGWGADVARPEHQVVRTPDGALLAVWDVPGGGPEAPMVVLPHCWGCSHEIWIPVARRLREQGYRVVLYDQRGHGQSTRGTVPLALDTLALDLEAVLEATGAHDAVLAGHSMGGMTVMALASYRPEVVRERAKAIVLVATSATAMSYGTVGRGPQLAGVITSSDLLSRAMLSKNGHHLVRGAFGTNPVRSHVLLTRDLFANCDRSVRGDFAVMFGTMNQLEGIATIDVPTTVMVGTRDTLTLPKKADQMVSTIPGSRLVTLKDRGHMLPLEDPDAVTDEILRAVKG
ncbi:MAG TPA: alpha/beta hydrolase [Acidimicrobiales bacterium]|nr:alpha/beta hydrolase [Acidimicrobiales bacterium]